jgi:hypothetical protein
MDFAKFPLEKVFYFVAGIIPGIVAFLIFQLAAPGSFAWLFTLGFLGYRTKLGLILFAAFVVGNTMTAFLSSMLDSLSGAIGTFIAGRRFKIPHLYPNAPWRDPRWRMVLKNYLGAQAPNDTRLLSKGFYEQSLEAVKHLPEEERSTALANINLRKLNAQIDDGNWAQWYDHFHLIVLNPDKRDFQWYVRYGLNFNLETAAVYVLLSAVVVPGVRHWWCIVPAWMWAHVLLVETCMGLMRSTDKWLTLSAQIKYLSDTGHSQGASEKTTEN